MEMGVYIRLYARVSQGVAACRKVSHVSQAVSQAVASVASVGRDTRNVASVARDARNVAQCRTVSQVCRTVSHSVASCRKGFAAA